MAKMTAFQYFMSEHTLVGMARNSCKFQNKQDEVVFVHRNILNKQQDWERYEIVEIHDPFGRPTKWVKATFSSTF